MPSWYADVPEGVDFAWCPEGCGGTTDDPYGGPCTACWRKIDEKKPDLYEQGGHLDGEFADERGKFDPLIGEQGEGDDRG